MWEFSAVYDACIPFWVTTKPTDGVCFAGSEINTNLPEPQTCIIIGFNSMAWLQIEMNDDGTFDEPSPADCPSSETFWVVNVNSCVPLDSDPTTDLYWYTWDERVVACPADFVFNECLMSCVPIEYSTEDPSVLTCELEYSWCPSLGVCQPTHFLFSTCPDVNGQNNGGGEVVEKNCAELKFMLENAENQLIECMIVRECSDDEIEMLDEAIVKLK